jgi:hypothetical protein
MPKVRNEALREAMTSQRNLKVTTDVVRRLQNIRDLWLAVHNDPDHTVQQTALEFFWLVRDILEGKQLEQLEYQAVSRKRVLAQAKEG